MSIAKNLAPRTKEEAKKHILECWKSGKPLNITSPRKDGDVFFVYKTAWRELLQEAKDSGDEAKLLSLLSFGSGSGVSTAYGQQDTIEKVG